MDYLVAVDKATTADCGYDMENLDLYLDSLNY